MLQIDLQGLDQVQHRLQTVVRQMITAAPGALYEEGQQIMEPVVLGEKAMFGWE